MYRFLGVVLALAGLALGVVAATSQNSETIDAFEAVVIAGLSLALLGFGAALGIVVPRRVVRERAERDARIASHGGVPWAVREDWARGEVSSLELAYPIHHQVGVFVVGVVGLTCIAWTSAWPVLTWGVLGASLIGAMGLGLRLRRRATLGDGRLDLSTVPAPPGSHFEGTLHLDSRWRGDAVRVRLDCLKLDVDYEGDVSWTSLWEKEMSVTPRRAGVSVDVPLRIRIPRSVRPTSFVVGETIDWKLTVRFGSGLMAPAMAFSIPVFAVSAAPAPATIPTRELAVA